MRKLLITLVALAASVACTGGSASDAERVQAIESVVWSPYCPGRLLKDCTTRQADELRQEIARRVERGSDDGEVLAFVEAEFGRSALARPAGSGIGLVIWLVPAAIFVAGALIVARTVGGWRTASLN